MIEYKKSSRGRTYFYKGEYMLVPELYRQPECVIQEGTVRSRLYSYVMGCSDFTTVEKILTTPTKKSAGRQKVEKIVEFPRQPFVDFMKLMPVGSLHHTVKYK